MKNKIISLISITFLVFSFQIQAVENNWKPAEDGDKIIMIRHALAPGSGDPKGFKIDNCETQRNLDQIGVSQSKKIGELFREKKLKLIKFFLVNGVGAKIQQGMHLRILKSFQR